jgi:Fe-S-cluster containining protein
MTKECSRCGKCCMYIALPMKTMDAQSIDYFMARGLERDEKQGVFIVPHRCAQLIDPPTSADKYSCAIHNTKPKSCRQFKGKSNYLNRRFHVPPGCTMSEEP